jgi:RNase adapter protein RapZ
MLGDLQGFLENWLPEYRKQDRAYLTVAIGCTGGRHRSVYLVERLAELLGEKFSPLIIKHRELVT